MREQAKAIFVWYLKARIDRKMIHKENDVLADNELVVAREYLKKSKYACLYMQNKFRRGFKLLNHYEVIILNESNKTHLTFLCIPSFFDTITALIEY